MLINLFDKDFRTKNFEYKLYSGHEFISSCQYGGDKYLYLRALGANFRKDKPNFKKDFPELVDDCPNLPDIENFSNFRNHSTILRISPKDLEIWLHYDTLDNLMSLKYFNNFQICFCINTQFLTLISALSNIWRERNLII